jgi:PAS domain S-box-containing protein
MSIYKRTIIMVCVILLILMGLLYTISNYIYRQGFEGLERKTVENNVTQVTQALSVNLDTLDAMCYDWAEWDDTYQFAQEYNQEYVDRNLQDDTFTSSKISLVSIFNASEEMVYGKAYDLINEEEIIFPDDFTNTAITAGLATPAIIGNTVAGVILFTGQPMLIVSQPIFTSWGEGPIAGALIFGRIIDTDVISQLAETTHLSVNLLLIPADDNNPDTNIIIESLNESGPTFIQAKNSDTIAGYTYVNDLNGNPVFIAEVIIPRDIFHQGIKAITLLHSFLLCIGVVFCIVFILLVKKLVLSRLINLSNNVSKIGSSTDVSGRVTISGNDELSKLGTNINEMLTSLENANKALRESEEKFSKAFRASPDAISISRLSDGVFLEINDSYTNIIGYSREELLGKNADDFNLWAKPDQRESMLQKIRDRIMMHNEEMEIRSKSGEIRTMLLSTEYVQIGDEPCLLVVGNDISERNKMEEMLANEATRRLILIEQSRDGIVILDQNGAVYEANRRFAEMLGYSPEEVLKLNVWDWEFLYPPEQVKEMIGTVDEAGDHFITRHRRKDGTTFDVEISTNGAMFAGQKLIFCVCRDITERTRMEKALRESEEKFSIAFRSSPNTMAITTVKEGKFIEINDIHSRLTGYTRDDTIGHTAIELGLWANEEDRVRMLEILKKNDRVNPEEFEFRIKSGEIRTWLFSAERLTIDGEPCIISITVDITERKRTERLQNDENYVLTLLGRGVELSELLDGIVRLGESHDPAIKGSAMLYDAQKQFLFPAATPSLPASYSKLMENGIPIGQNMGACGTAAHLKKRVTIPDIRTTLIFPKEVAEQTVANGLLACWSQPIIASNGDLLGTIANYSSKTGKPSASDIRVLEWSARIAAIAIERKQAETALRESEEKFSIAFRSSPATIAITTLKDSRYIDVNDSYVNATGYSLEELIGKTTKDVNIWAKSEDRTRMLKTLKEQGSIKNEEFDFRVKSGEIRTWLFSAERINIAGEPCLIGVSVDITERKRAEEALREREKRFSDIAENALEWIWEVDTKGKYTYSSPVVEKILGYNHEEMLKKHFYDFFLPEEREELKKAAFEAFARKQPIKDFINKNRCKNGKMVELLTTGVPVIDEVGNLRGYRGVDTDITERRRAEQALKESMANLEQSSSQLAATNKELEAFSYSVSHDLRSPLRSIDGFSQSLLEDYQEKLDETGRDYLKRLRNASQKMGELIDGILKLSRLTRSEMHQEPTNLSTLAEEIANRLQEIQPERRVKFAIEKDLIANGDPQLLRVLLENLLGNAWKFTSKKSQGKIEFSTERNNGKTAYFIRDNGAGFDMTYADKLFSAFQRLHEATEFPGTGIGLATVQRIINRHGGSIWAEGAVGKGATFHFTLD